MYLGQFLYECSCEFIKLSPERVLYFLHGTCRTSHLLATDMLLDRFPSTVSYRDLGLASPLVTFSTSSLAASVSRVETQKTSPVESRTMSIK